MLSFGSSSGNRNNCQFSYAGSGYYSIIKREDFRDIFLKEWTKSKVINRKGYNKPSIRKVDSEFWFFINVILVSNFPSESLMTVNQIYLYTGHKSLINIDFIRVSYLNKRKIDASNELDIAYTFAIRNKYYNESTHYHQNLHPRPLANY